jgi:hypothetical protein
LLLASQKRRQRTVRESAFITQANAKAVTEAKKAMGKPLARILKSLLTLGAVLQQ